MSVRRCAALLVVRSGFSLLRLPEALRDRDREIEREREREKRCDREREGGREGEREEERESGSFDHQFDHESDRHVRPSLAVGEWHDEQARLPGGHAQVQRRPHGDIYIYIYI